MQQVTTSGTTRDNEWQRMTTSGNEWQQVTTNDNEWQRMTASGHFDWFSFFLIKEEPTTMHPKETLLTLKRILKRGYWSKDRNKPLKRNINRRNQVSRNFSCLRYIQLYTFQKIVWHKISRFRQPWQVFIWDSPWIVIKVRDDDDTRRGHHTTHSDVTTRLGHHQGRGCRPYLLCCFACCHWSLSFMAFVTFSGHRLLSSKMPTGICSVWVKRPLYSMALRNCLMQICMLHVCCVTIVVNFDPGGDPTV